MAVFPKPPMSNRSVASSIPTPPGVGPVTYIPPIPTVVEIPPIDVQSGALSENEVTIILKTSLLPEHHRDQKVINFIAHYMRCRNTVQAGREAGLVGNEGYHLRNRPDVHEAITRLTEKSVMKYGFDATEVIERVKEISGLDPIEFENADGTFKTSLRDIPPESRRAIKKFKCKNTYGTDLNGMPVVTGQLIEVEMHDKLKSLELLGREKDIFKQTTTVQHDVTKNMAQVLLDSSRRADDHARQMIDVTPQRMQIASGDESE